MITNELQIWDASRPQDVEQWLDLWAQWPRREIFAHPAYIQLFATGGDKALCAALEHEGQHILYPFVLRDLSQLDFWPSGLPPAADITTPYGYGGPFTWSTGKQRKELPAFWSSFNDWAQRNLVISEFIRFTLFDDHTIGYPGEVSEVAPNIVRNLEPVEDHIWMDVEHKVRKNVKKAQRLGVYVERDSSGERFEEFLQLYVHTMDRRTAAERYYFDRIFFETIHRELCGHFQYFYALHERRVVSAELVLVSADNVYSFLGGTNSSAFDLRPNDLLKWEIIRWARSEGKRNFVLGGGYHPEDGIYRYKLAFSPSGERRFLTGRRVLREDLYELMIKCRRERALASGYVWSPERGFFPAYRS